MAFIPLLFIFVFPSLQPAFAQTNYTISYGTAAASPSPTAPPLTTQKIFAIQALGDQLASRINIALIRLRKLVDRTQARTTKMQANGQDVSQLTSWIASMNANLASTRSSLTKFQGDLALLSPADDPQQDLLKLQLDIKLTKDGLTATLTTLKLTATALASASAVSTTSF